MRTMDDTNGITLPSLAELGKDLLRVSRVDVAVSFLRPLVCFTLFWPLALSHHYVLAAFAVAGLMFFTYTSASHDLVHRTLHLPERVDEALLAGLEALCLRSGHAFRLTHLQHHKHFPDELDIEGAQPSKGFWPALACGPFHQARLFIWAWRHGRSQERRWMLAEGLIVIAVFTLSGFLWRSLPELLLYIALVVSASWIFPLATVWWPHRAEGVAPLQQTRGFRGRIVPLLFFQHTYHLEHHLYPGVSSHRWAELGRRLEPHLLKAGVEFVQLP